MIIGIYDFCNKVFDETTQFLGGSETWLNEISFALSKLGHEVFLFCKTPKFHTINNVHYIEKSKIKEICDIVEFDKFIFSRGIQNFNLIKSKEYDLFLHDEVIVPFIDGIKTDMTSLKRIDKIFVLSNYHKEYFCKKYGEEYRNKIKISMNGIHNELYKKNTNKENSMIWSSCYERGLEFFINYVLPKIKKEIPDFKLKVCSYNIPKHFSNVITLGQLNKEQLAKEQCSAKIWCYPNLGYSSFGIDFRETFCITAVENAAAGNCILTTNLGGLGTTCNGINFLKNDFYNNEKILDLENYGNYLADMCIKALKNEFFTTFNFEKYTWENAAKSLL